MSDKIQRLYESFVSTGYRDIDTVLGGGFSPSSLNLIAAPTGMGTSTLMANIAIRATKATAKPVLFVSLESPAELLNRRIHRIAGTVTAFPVLVQDDLQSVRAIADFIEGYGLLGDLALVLIDNLALLVDSTDEAAKALKRLAISKSVPVLLSAKIHSRHRDGKHQKRPIYQSDFQDFGILPEVADSVIALYREEYYTGEPSSQSEAIIVKNRHGSTALVSLRHNLESGRFEGIGE